MAQILNGKAVAAVLKTRVKEKISTDNPPSLAVVLVGQNPASLTYIRGKEKACNEVGIRFQLHALEENTSQADLLALIDTLNADNNIHGLLVQQPLPPHLDKHAVVSRIDPRKDVDCLHPHNVGLVMTGRARLLPATPAGVIMLLDECGVSLEGKHCVIIGRSDIVGKPLALMLLARDATVTVCHSRTQGLADICRRADVLVAAAGRPRLVTPDMISPGCIVVDVGVNRLEGKKICGDVDYKGCFEKASFITPVPGGVGPMTVAVLMENCLKAWEAQHA